MNNLIITTIFIVSIIHSSDIQENFNTHNNSNIPNPQIHPPDPNPPPSNPPQRLRPPKSSFPTLLSPTPPPQPTFNTTLFNYMQSSAHQHPLSTSQANSCFILERRKTLQCWGDNLQGQLDIGKEYRQWIHKVALGVRHVCIIRQKEKNNTQQTFTQCWGTNNQGQLNIDQDSWTVDIQAGRGHTCVQKIDIDQELEGMSSSVNMDKKNRTKQVMDDNFFEKFDRIDCYGSFVSIKDIDNSVENFDQIEDLSFNKNKFIINFESGYSHICAIGQNSLSSNLAIDNLTEVLHLSCAGSNQFGELDVPILHNSIVVYSLGDSNTCALVSDGVITCWGSNLNLQNEVQNNRSVIRPFYVAVISGAAHTCGHTAANQQHFWGNNDWDQARDMKLDRTKQQNMSLGGFHNCLQDGVELRCWGSNSFNQCNVPKDL